jgi:hypothetical protein
MQADEGTGLLEDPALLSSHIRRESLLPQFIITSFENMSEAVNDVTEQIEEIAHDMTTFELLDVDALVEAAEAAEVEKEGDEPGTTHPGALSIDQIDSLIHPHDPMDPFDHATREKLGMIPLAVMVFYSVSGGPFGIESSVRSGGYFYSILGFIVMPFVWSLQEALMTAELGTTFQEEAGGCAWVETAFGQRAGWMAGYLGWIGGATDNAIYVSDAVIDGTCIS